MVNEKIFPVKIGLEVHGYLNTQEKLFCMCRTFPPEGVDVREEKPNTRVCPICTGQPGSKPMLVNAGAVRKLMQIALVLKCKVVHDKDLIWQRKHYNWADLPKGYQNTISGAHAVFPAVHGKFNGVGIREVHLEEDPAQWNPETGRINYNRSGLPLIEIVTEPDFSNSEDVVLWLKNLILSLSYIKAIRKNAGIKVDVNVSTYGERVEMKNLNSIEKIRKAIEYEIARQLEEHGAGVVQKRETLAFDEKLGRTVKMREKEGQADYRFIPDPDLPLIRLGEKNVKEIERELPEMPEVKLDRLVKKFKIDKKNAEILARNLELVEFVEGLVREKVDVGKNISWITIELLRVLNYNKKTLEDDDVEIEPVHLAELISEIEKNNITPLKAKQIMNDFVPKSFSLKENKEEGGKIADNAIENLCRQVIKQNPRVVEEYKEGRGAALNWLIGGVMKLSGRRADHVKVKECLGRLLG
ncbi:Asp-tRNA(Asn)/Glu-tRNA(Gln) amidotransferase GatCAB subunit B [Candidatus Pacearchaeota archaeon]|nr:Asp-tRNA(Asn)/Glu-tRNA(Gln) amidotransferase GatCAB subunit B [Candidatus Pacearchaeota archaeon]